MSQVFDAYARYYDLLYRDKDYVAEAEYVASHIRKHAPGATRILELGCGTGAHAAHLAQIGFTVHGVDSSAVMLARASARKANLPAAEAERLTFAGGDARTLRSGETYDAVISLFHVMSYQTTNADLEAVFETAAIHLIPGGLFLFDFWYGPAVLTLKPEIRIKRLEDEHIKVTRIAEPIMHVNENIVDVNYTVFIEEKETGRVEQLQETHQMRYLFLPEIEKIIEECGLQLVASQAWMSDCPMNCEQWAGFIVASQDRLQRP
ncbi:MAG: class I SAM-dependent methyltransferase [Desulfobacterales bacterium]|nr:class I SAM-dependent methyltransferase [Desulfobacterales bacterium]